MEGFGGTELSYSSLFVKIKFFIISVIAVM
jgi:hypothetical protein